MMVLLLKCKRSKDSFESQRVLLKKIKAVISSHTQKFVGFRQQVCGCGFVCVWVWVCVCVCVQVL